MSQPFALNCPLNNLSFGSVSIAILREAYRRGLNPAIFPIGGGWDLSAQVPDAQFNAWLEQAINSAQQRHSRKHAAIKLWHLNGSLETYSARDSRLLTFFELDQLTPLESNVLRQHDRVYVTSTFTQSVFNQYGIKSEYLPLGFDAHNFRSLETRPRVKGATSFLLAGKCEKRKSHVQVIKAWVKRYGGNPAYRLNCALWNHFLSRHPDPAQHEAEVLANMQAILAPAFDGQLTVANGRLVAPPNTPGWNVTFLPWAPDNATYNSTLQSSEIVIAMSGGEGRDLPVYHATALGAWPVAMKAHAYLDYLNDDNAVFVNPNGKQPAADGIFFAPNAPFNNGNLFTFDDADFIRGCEEAERRAKGGLNGAGLALQRQTYAETLDKLIEGV